VSEDTPTPTITATDSSPLGDFLTATRELVASGKSVYGPADTPAAQAKLQELDAKIALGRQLGEIAPAPEAWSIERAAKERLEREFRQGDPSKFERSEILEAGLAAKFDRLGKLSTREQANLAQEVADDFAYRSSDVSMRHSFTRGGQTPTGHQVVEQLLKDAQPAVDASVEPGKRAETMKLLRCDRQLLELYAVRGRNLSAYSSRKAQLGIKS
jgi:hypothetical protein